MPHRKLLSRFFAGPRWIGIAVLLFIGGAAADFFAYPLLPVRGTTLNRGENGSWLRYVWYFGSSPEPVDHMAARLQRQQVRYAYFHVRYVKQDGTLRYHYPDQARALIKKMHAAAPGIKCLAWIYVGNEHGMTGVHLDNVTVRRNAVQEAAWLVNACGFDGVQWDYEMCRSGDAGFLSLLSETRERLPKGKILAVASPIYLPVTIAYWGWSADYYARVARSCDQIAVMAYDTGMYLPRAYAGLVAMQVEQVTRAVAAANPSCRVLIGFPTYGKGGASHFAPSENVTVALKGIRDGLANPNARTAVFGGIANFADYTTDPNEERLYQTLWLDNHTSQSPSQEKL